MFSGFAPAAARRRRVSAKTVYMMLGFIAAGPVVRSVVGRGRLELQHRYRYTGVGADLRSRLAVRRRLRAAGGAAARDRFRPVSSGAYLLSGAVVTILALWISGLRESEEYK